MKKLLLLILTGTLMSLSGCGSKKIVNQISEKEKTTFTKSDSVKLVERNKAIVDSLKLKISQSATGDKRFDDAVNKAVSDILTKLNTSKSSGDNSYSLTYDEALQELRAVMNIGATENLKVINNATVHTKEVVLNTKEIPIKFIPQWVLVGSIFGGCCAIALVAWILYKVSRFFKPKIV